MRIALVVLIVLVAVTAVVILIVTQSGTYLQTRIPIQTPIVQTHEQCVSFCVSDSHECATPPYYAVEDCVKNVPIFEDEYHGLWSSNCYLPDGELFSCAFGSASISLDLSAEAHVRRYCEEETDYHDRVNACDNEEFECIADCPIPMPSRTPLPTF